MKKLIFTLLTLITLSSSLFTNLNATNVSGGIYANTTWTLINSPYIVTDTVVVFPGVTLTIEPGVVVKFDNHMYIEIRQANFIANGTSLDSITFTSNSNNPYPGIWGGTFDNVGGIWLNGTQAITSASFNYCNVFYATTGINIMEQDTTYIKNSNLNFNTNGLTSNSIYTIIDTCNFTYNTTDGINGGYLNYINYCNLSHNGYGSEVMETRMMSNCIIDSNQTGINGISGSILNNCIIKYNQTGINIAEGTNFIRYCIIDSNSVNGIYDMTSQGDSIVGCEIKYNGNIGLIIYSGGSPNVIVTKCDIENNHTGVEFNDIYVYFFCNKVCNNTTYDVHYNVAHGSNFIISDNYWCSTDSAIIHSHIYDGYTNINLGLVSVLPVDSIGCYQNNIFTGIDNSQIKENTQINIYPNPNNGSFDVVYHLPHSQISIPNSQFLIYDVMGREVYNFTLKDNDGAQNIDASSLSKGIYYWEIRTNKGIEGKGKLVFVGD